MSIVTKYLDYNYIYNCPKCKDKLKIIDVNTEAVRGNIQCPKCNSTNLHVSEFGILWD
ncbi:hypothetical protein KWV42_10465 [Clostridioides difficile]|uniref:hypothetical protein n=1 Tax=Clostridioides difficile TaxID=1496 RepID=UPI001C18B627|nr:hypothetical protein [Clostridioides difficile]MBY1883509.1 hypothetical protein [Clostridioides difficile]MBZ0781372.1 hypothetical protein [Clostridioides difficile]MBZ0855016.1 hypothetical protein [Clostridioides difficile]MCG7701634.1 hypothetical protein [Clostridioides difficile]